MKILLPRRRSPNGLPAVPGAGRRAWSGYPLARAEDGRAGLAQAEAHTRVVGAGLVISSDATVPLFPDVWLETLLENLPPEPARIPVIVNCVLRSDPTDLADLLAAAISPFFADRPSGIRLVLSGAGVPGLDSPASLLASRLGVDVVAADGSILLVGRNLLYVDAYRHHGRGGGWRYFHPDGSTALPVALRHPAPPWERTLPATAMSLPSGIVVEPIPAGIWMHEPRLGCGLLSDPVFGIMPRDDRIVVVSGGPDRLGPGPDSIEEIIGLLPRELRELVCPVGYDSAGMVPQAYSVAIGQPSAPAAPPWMSPDTAPCAADPVPDVTPSVPLATDRTDGDDVIIVGGSVRPEPWWSADPDLYSVITQYDPDTATFTTTGAGLDPAGLVEYVIQQDMLGGRPILLVTDTPPAGWAVQVLADGLGVPVVAGPRPRGRWWAAWPRYVDQDIPAVRTVADCYPFDAAAKAILTAAPQRLPRAGMTPAIPGTGTSVVPSACSDAGVLFAADTGGQTLDARYHVWCQIAHPGWFGIVIDRNPANPTTAFRIGDRGVGVWALALALAGMHDDWSARELVLLSDPPPVGVDPQARVLASHLGVGVTVADRPLWTWGRQLTSAGLPFRNRPDRLGVEAGRPRFTGHPDGRWWRYAPTRSGHRSTRPTEITIPGVESRWPDGVADGHQPRRPRRKDIAIPTPVPTPTPVPIPAQPPVDPVAPADSVPWGRPPWEDEPDSTDADDEYPTGVSPDPVTAQRGVPPEEQPPTERTGMDAWPVGIDASTPKATPLPERVDLADADSVLSHPIGTPAVPAVSTAPPDVAADASTRHPVALPPHESADLIRRRHGEHVRVIARLLAEQPGLRVPAAGSSDTDLVTGLVALRAYLAGDEPDVDAILRSGAGLTGGSVAAFAASGLWRLPTFRGPVYRGVSPGAAAVARCYPGAVVQEHAFVQATASESAVFATEAEYVIWSYTGRRVSMLEMGVERADIVFMPGTRFIVVAAGDPSGPATTNGCSPPRILLAEMPPGHTDGRNMDEVRERLEQSTLTRDTLRAESITESMAAAAKPGCPQTSVLGATVEEH
jgi:hypothetical protein